jgi:hypothetical protein
MFHKKTTHVQSTDTDAAVCPISWEDLAAFAYARKIGEIGNERFTRIGTHLENCEQCQKGLSVLYATDPFLADQRLPKLKFLEPNQARRQALIAKVTKIATDFAKQHSDPGVSALARQSLQELLPDDDEPEPVPPRARSKR